MKKKILLGVIGMILLSGIVLKHGPGLPPDPWQGECTPYCGCYCATR